MSLANYIVMSTEMDSMNASVKLIIAISKFDRYLYSKKEIKNYFKMVAKKIYEQCMLICILFCYRKFIIYLTSKQ